jgi:hypothetical protein
LWQIIFLGEFMKLFLVLAVMFQTASMALAAAVSPSGYYICSFNNGKQNTWVINQLARNIVVTSSAHNGPINVQIDESFELGVGTSLVQIVGVLPSPWAAGTRYEIFLRDTMFTSTLRITGPAMTNGKGEVVKNGRTVSIPMVCR